MEDKSIEIKKDITNIFNKVSAVFENIPGFLSSHDKKVNLSKIGNYQSFSQYDEPLFWLDFRYPL